MIGHLSGPNSYFPDMKTTGRTRGLIYDQTGLFNNWHNFTYYVQKGCYFWRDIVPGSSKTGEGLGPGILYYLMKSKHCCHMMMLYSTVPLRTIVH